MRISTRIGTVLASLAVAVMVVALLYGGAQVGSRRPSIEPPGSASPASSVPTQQAPQRSQSPTEQPSPSPEPTFAPAPSVEPAPDDNLALAGRGGVPGRLHCGDGRSFGFDDLANPTGAEQLIGPEYDMLRSTVGNLPTREATRDETTITFLADVQDDRNWEYGPYLDVHVVWDGTAWKWAGSGDCEPRAWGPPGYGAATWTLDPAFKVPSPTTKTLHLLVAESTCSSGRSAHGRIGPAYVTFDRLMVRIELLVQLLPGGQDCQAVAPTPARLRLSEPIGDRTLKDMNAHLLTGAGG